MRPKLSNPLLILDVGSLERSQELGSVDDRTVVWDERSHGSTGMRPNTRLLGWLEWVKTGCSQNDKGRGSPE